TQTIDAFNKKVQQDDRVENVLLPIRDGLFLIRKLRD
ncbi:MAG: methyltransferase, partial [Bacteroidota bacterium]